ncbi:DUF4214 domain-containing protein [Duganella sp. HH101]|uniref:DUF4214 domain-containing protein n=1 Tax=Duganella sp. HH101 TaxID=1781066 RepID=UPI000874839B|nr:DUF4214 domain-containing protein [Duganella sp. HH101]OFA02572.1 S-layer protein [Duganella sp. HH101]
MAATDYNKVVQQLYISYFGRPADPGALTNFSAQLLAADPGAGTDAALTTTAALSAFSQANPTSAVGKLVGSFASKPEAGQPPSGDHLSIMKFVNDVYNNVLHRNADEGGNFWINAIESGALSRENAALAITEGALSNTSPQGLKDAALVANVNAIATDFTASLDTIAKVIAFSGDVAAADAKAMLTQVTDTTTVAAFHATVTATIDNLGHQNTVEGKLTTGVDTFVGTAGNDLITAVIDGTTGAVTSTFTGLDTIDGKAGNDVLNLNILNGVGVAGTAVTSLPTVGVTNVETANIRAGVDLTADVSAWSVSTVNVTQGKAVSLLASSTAAVNVSGTTGVLNIDGGKSQVISASGANVTSGTIGTAAEDTKGDITITVAKVATNDVVVTGGANVTVTTTGATTTNTIDIGNGTQVATGAIKVNVTGADYDAALGASQPLGVITVKGGTSIEVNQSAYGSTAAAAADVAGVTTVTQGAVNIDGAGTATTVTVKQDAAVTANTGTAADAGVKQAATYTFGVLLQGQTVTVAGLTFTALKDLTGAEVATAFASLSASAVQGAGKVANGSYTGTFAADWTSGAASGATLTFTAKTAATAAASALSPTVAQGSGSATLVQPTAGATVAGHTNVDYDAGVAGVAGGAVAIQDTGATDKIATVVLSGYGASSTVASDALTSLSLANAATDLVVTNTVQKTLSLTVDALDTGATVQTNVYENINLHVASGSIFGLTATGAKALVVDGAGSANLTGSTFGALESVVVKGTAGLNLANTASGTLKSVDTSGTTGTVTASIDGTKATYTGGAGVDKVTLVASAAITKAVNLGAGDDTLTFTGTNVPTVDGKIDGGTGTNTLVLAAADAETLTANSSFNAAISNFQKVSIGAVASGATKTVDLTNVDGISYVISANGGNGTAETQTFTVTAGTGAAVAEQQTVVITGAASGAGNITVNGATIALAGTETIDQIGAAIVASKAAILAADATVADVTYNAGTDTVSIVYKVASGNVAAGAAFGAGATGATFAAPTDNAVAFDSNAGNMTVGGVNVALTAGMSVDAVGAAIAAAQTAIKAGNATVDTVTYDAATDTVTVKYLASAGNVGAIVVTDPAATGATFGGVVQVDGTNPVGGIALTLSHMANNGTVELNAAGSGVTVTMTDATGTADVLNAKITNSAGINVGTIAAAGVETVKVELDDTDTAASKITAVHTVTIGDTSLKSLVLTGDAGGIVTHTSNVVTSIDGSALTLALTAGTLTTATVAATIKGGAGADVLTANHTGDILIGGAGNDTLKIGGNNGGSVYANGVTLTGGAGNDTFDVSGANVVATVNDYATITDFSKGDILKISASNAKFVAAVVSTGSTAVFQDLVNKVIHDSVQNDAGWFQFGGDTYVVEHRSASTTTFTNGTDNIVKIVGAVDLSNVGSYSNSADTLLIFG